MISAIICVNLRFDTLFLLHTIIFNLSPIVTVVSMITTILLDGEAPEKVAATP